jgi:hypothetical protein
VLAQNGEGAGVFALLESDSEGDGAASNATTTGATHSKERIVNSFIVK